MFDMRNFKTVMPETGRISTINIPKVTFSTTYGYVYFNRSAIELVNAPKVVVMYDSINQIIAIIPTSSNPKGVRCFCTERAKRNGHVKWVDNGVLKLFRNCDGVSQDGLYHFNGEWDDESKVLTFDLKKGQYIGKTKRKNSLNRR